MEGELAAPASLEMPSSRRITAVLPMGRVLRSRRVLSTNDPIRTAVAMSRST